MSDLEVLVELLWLIAATCFNALSLFLDRFVSCQIALRGWGQCGGP